MLYYVIDTETTGLKAGWNEITQISIIRCSDRTQLTRDIAIEHPERCQQQALQVIGKTIEELLIGCTREQAVSACERFWNQDGKTPEHRCLIAHNAQFDKRFCHALWQSVNKRFPVVCWLDTLIYIKLWSERMGVKLASKTLEKSLEFAKIAMKDPLHNASSDAQAVYRLWKRGMDARIDHLPAIKRFPHLIE
jgi:DNA polymerase III epsilon subunit-like protein